MTVSPLADGPVPPEVLGDVARLEREYFERLPDLADPTNWQSTVCPWSAMAGLFDEIATGLTPDSTAEASEPDPKVSFRK